MGCSFLLSYTTLCDTVIQFSQSQGGHAAGEAPSAGRGNPKNADEAGRRDHQYWQHVAALA
jgi:hypothetical protein